ncbi:hypothetical protein BV25DRAFT_1821436 [Artomyces pyxidatus]|uniref:Uncharacterized protein n=1 Tax=Artomyces pyxidatus TaxID=48021 RepID=A0ACB8TC49_9AGAM|nr:hypothetical protein BV25DRAFT_1821436 [Artomyces pyxidatus]
MVSDGVTGKSVDREEGPLPDEARLQAYAQSLRRQKNARAPVSRLPVEIVVHIFSLFQASPRLPHNRYTRPPAWLAVTHVYQRWRNISLSCPILWTDIIVQNSNWAKAMLSRSKGAPITLCLQPGKWIPVSALRLNLGRTRSLQIDGRFILQASHALRTPAPLLETLKLLDVSSRPHHPKLSTSYIFPDGVSKLRELCLRNFRTSWPIHLVGSNMMHLSIENLVQENRPSLAQLQETLLAAPNLQTLVLNDALPIHPPEVTAMSIVTDRDTCSPVMLPSIMTLILAAKSGMDVLYFTANCLLPSLVSVELTTGSNDTDTEASWGSDNGLLLSLCTLYQPAYSPQHRVAKPYTFRSLTIEYEDSANDEDWWIRAGGPTTAGSDARNPLSSGAHFDERFAVRLRYKEAQDVEDFCRRMCLLLPLQYVEALVIDCDLLAHGDDWLHMFCCMPCVERVFVRGAPAIGLAAALDDPKGARAKSVQRRPEIALLLEEMRAVVPVRLFPRLSHLVIMQVDLEQIVEDDAMLSSYEHLMLGLASRSDWPSGTAPLWKLGIFQCDVLEAHVKQLAGYIMYSEVEWDDAPDGFTQNPLFVDEEDENDDAVLDLAVSEHSDA